jgi:Ca-activated chloride channel family protein
MKATKLFLVVFTLFAFSACTKFSDDFSGNYGYSNSSGGDRYNDFEENPFIRVLDCPISTFGIDADGASYANVRRFLMDDNQIPSKGAIRTEELINYFDLDYPYDDPSHSVNLNGEVCQCPWDTANKLIRIGIKGKPIASSDLPPSSFVFLIDVSGSMNSSDKLDLLKSGFKLFVDQLTSDDRVAIVSYAGKAETVLTSTPGSEKTTIKNAIDGLGSGGGTAGAQGIITAYEIAQQNYISNGNNRIVIGTDGDFNIGPSNQDELIELIKEKRDLGIYLTVLGVGRGNLNDGTMEQIANNGNGNYEYIDKVQQLNKVFIYDYSKFYTVAKDCKVQVVFNPNIVDSYRLIGYENRLLEAEDFENDTIDAGEIGADQNITALYEIIPVDNANKEAPAFTIDFRYKEPGNTSSILMQLLVYDTGKTFFQSSNFMRFTASIAGFSMLLRNSMYLGTTSYDKVLTWLNTVSLTDEHGFKAELKNLVNKAKKL